MKISGLILTTASLLAFTTGCDKDDNVAPEKAIVGEWRMTNTHTDNGVVDFGLQDQTFSYHGTEYNATTTYTENPNQFTSSGYYKYEFTTTFLGTTETIILQSDAEPGTGVWSIEGDTLFQTLNGIEKKYVILELNETDMRLRLDLNTIEGGLLTTATIFTDFEKE